MSTSTRPLRTKRWCDPREPDDGFRLLVCRYRPRGLHRDRETWHAWWRELAPSRELHAAGYGRDEPPISWPEYRARYFEEMEAQEEKIRELGRRVMTGEALALLCSAACSDPERCHRTLLVWLIESQVLALGGRIARSSRQRRLRTEESEP